MRVLRVMHPGDSQGIYTSEYSNSKITKNLYDGNTRHPSPVDDSLLRSNGFRFNNVDVMNFGFKSWNQMRSWIYQDETLHRAFEAGFKLYILEIPEVIVGNTQCCWDKRQDITVVAAYNYWSMSLLEKAAALAFNKEI